MTEKYYTETVEVCPHCECENVFSNWDCKTQGYIATCWQCGKQIMLCDECLHADDNPYQYCDWHARIIPGRTTTGDCFRARGELPF